MITDSSTAEAEHKPPDQEQLGPQFDVNKTYAKICQAGNRGTF